MLTAKDLQNLLPEFINHLNSTNSSRSTIKNYSADLRRIVENLPADLSLDNTHLSAALEVLKEKFSEASIRRFSYSLKAFVAWINSQGYSLNPGQVNQTGVSEDNKISPIQSYVQHIQSQGSTKTTTKQYSSDLNSFFSWLKPTQTAINDKIINKVSRFDINRYISYLRSKQASPATIKRYLYSLKDFFNFHKEDIVYETNPVQIDSPNPKENHLWQRFKLKKPRWWHAYRGHPISDYLNYAALAAVTLFIGLGLFQELLAPKPINITSLKNDIQKGLVLAATPPRILSFQGRLTNPSGTPTIIATDIEFRIYTSTSGDTGDPCASTCLWESKTWSVTPDSNGIFSVQLGDTGQSDTAIPASLFSDNATLYLGVKIGADSEATPRQRIASSTYALNSDSLDGIDSLSFLRSDASDNFTSGTLTFDSGTTLTGADGSTLTVNSSTIGIGNATGDTITVNGTPTFTTDTNFTLAGTENVAMTSDLAGTVDVISLIATPSSSAGTTQGVFIQQADSANTNGLDVVIKIDNADTDLLLTDAIAITNTGAFGNGYTNFLNTPTIDITGAGAITGATGITSSGTITFSSLITDANAVLYTTTGGVVTRVVETETGSQCLLSGAGASGIPVWGSCGGGGFSGEVDDTTNDSLTFTSDDASPPAGTVDSIFRDNTGDLNINAVSGKTINLQIAGADEYNFSSTALALNGNSITSSGTITLDATSTVIIPDADTFQTNDVTSTGALTLTTGSNNAILITPNGTGNVQITGTTTGVSNALDVTKTVSGCAFSCFGVLARPELVTTETVTAYGILGQIRTNTGATLTRAAGLGTTAPGTVAGTIATYAGLDILNVGDSDVTTAIGIALAPISGSTNNYGICFDCDGSYTPTTVAGGISWGTDSPAELFRSAANTLSVGTTTTITATGALTISSGTTNALTLDPVGAGSIVLGSADVTSISFTTDNNADTDFTFAGGATFNDDFVLTAGAGEVTEVTRTLTNNTAENGITLAVTASDTGAATSAQYGFYLDNAASTEALDAAIALNNTDADDTVGAGVLFAAGGAGTDFTYGVDFSTATFGTAELRFKNSGTLSETAAGTWTFDKSAAGTTILVATDDDTNSALTIQSSGTGTLTLNPTGTGQVVLTSSNTSASALDLNATGTVSGAAITLDTTNGGITLTAAGASNGDITLAATDGININGTAGSLVNIGTSNVTQTIAIGLGTNIDLSLTDPNWSISGAGLITTASNLAVNGGTISSTTTITLDATSTIILADYITDANAVLYTTTAGVVTRVVETETASLCLLSGSGASGVPSWSSCPGGAFSGEVDDTTNDSLTFTSDDASPPAGTVNSIFRDNTGDLNINTISGKTLNIQIAGADEYNFSATALALNGNDITSSGTITLDSSGTVQLGTDDDLSTTGDIDMVFASAEDFNITNSSWAPASGIGLVDINVTSATNNARGIDNYFDLNSTAAVTQYGYYGYYDATSIALATDVQPNYIGIYQSVNKTGSDTANSNQACSGSVDCYTNVYGIYIETNNTSTTSGGADDDNVRNTYGGYFSATGGTDSTSTAYGIYISATGADTNYGIEIAQPTTAAIHINANGFAPTTLHDGLLIDGAITVNSAADLYASINSVPSYTVTANSVFQDIRNIPLITFDGGLTQSSDILNFIDLPLIHLSAAASTNTSITGIAAGFRSGAAFVDDDTGDAGNLTADSWAAFFADHDAVFTGVGASVTLTNSYGLRVDNMTNNGTLTNQFGVYLSPLTSGTNNYGICFDCDGTYSSATVGAGIQWGTDSAALSLYRASTSLGELNITDGTNTLFQFIDVATNFGGLGIAGAWMSQNTYWGEEFNSFRASCSAETVQARGDAGNKTCATTTGDISTADVVGGTGDCIWRSVADATNGYEQINTADGNSTTSCVAYLGSASANDAQLIFNSNNLPVFEMKVRPSRAATGDDDSRYFVGIGNIGAASSGTSTDSQAVMDATNDTGIYFSNCTAPQTATSCNDSTWNVSVQVAGSNPVTSDCGVTISTTQFAYMRVVVVSAGASAISVRAYVDGDVSNGIQETLCPAFSSPPTINGVNWGFFADTFADTSLNSNFNLDIDYIRIWQDDAPENTADAATEESKDTVDIAGLTPGVTPSQQIASQAANILDKEMTDDLASEILDTAAVLWYDSGGKVVSWVSKTGEAFFTKVTALAGDFGKLVFGEAVVKKDAKTAGEGSFSADQTEVFIESDKVNEESLINLTASTKTGGLSLYIKEKRVGEGFVVALERNSGDQPDQATASATQAIRFSWFIINQK